MNPRAEVKNQVLSIIRSEPEYLNNIFTELGSGTVFVARYG